MEQLELAFAEDINPVKFAPLSRFGVVEMTRARTGPSLDEIVVDRFGNRTTETQVLECLRTLQSEGRVMPGAKLSMTVTQDVYDWLQSSLIDWKTPLTEKIGARFDVSPGARFSISGDR